MFRRMWVQWRHSRRGSLSIQSSRLCSLTSRFRRRAPVNEHLLRCALLEQLGPPPRNRDGEHRKRPQVARGTRAMLRAARSQHTARPAIRPLGQMPLACRTPDKPPTQQAAHGTHRSRSAPTAGTKDAGDGRSCCRTRRETTPNGIPTFRWSTHFPVDGRRTSHSVVQINFILATISTSRRLIGAGRGRGRGGGGGNSVYGCALEEICF